MLFSSADFALHEQGERGVGCNRYQRVSEEIITDALSGPNEIEFDELALLVMERLPMKETHVKDVCKSMKGRGLIDYQLEPKARKPSEGTLIRSAGPSH